MAQRSHSTSLGKQRLLRAVNRLLQPARVQVIPSWRLDVLNDFHHRFAAPDTRTPPPVEWIAQLNGHRDRLEQLRHDYDRVGLDASAWTVENVESGVDLRAFRKDNMFVFQGMDTSRFQYVESARYANSVDHLRLLERLTEDGAFGATVVNVDGRDVSRDLLDSVLELNFLEQELGLSTLDRAVILDIGAGYGRLAHRATAAFPNIDRYLCTDGVPESTFLQEFYLTYREVTAGEVVPLDQMELTDADDGIDLAINVHSFPEMPMATSRWWFDHLARCQVPNVFLVTDYDARSTALESDGRRHGDFTDHLRELGYRCVVDRPKYDDSIATEFQLYPAQYRLFRRDDA